MVELIKGFSLSLLSRNTITKSPKDYDFLNGLLNQNKTKTVQALRI